MMSDFLANIGWTITGVSVVVCVIQVPAILIFFGLVFGIMYLINPKI